MAEAVTDGTLGFEKARSIAGVAAPDTEGALVQMAVHATVGQTQRICRAWRRAERLVGLQREGADGGAPAVTDPRPTVVVVRDADGVEMTVRFDHVRGELVLAGLETATRQVQRERRHAAPVEVGRSGHGGTPACAEDRHAERLTAAEWRAEGLMRLAGSFRATQPDGLQPSGFDTSVVLHLGLDTLHGPDVERAAEAARPRGPDVARPDGPGRDDWRRRDGMAILEPSGVQIRRDLARALACDAGLLTVIEDGDGNPLHLGRRKNSIPPALRRAVHARHRHCAWPGCAATAVQLHHVQHRADGGHDDVEGLVPECLAHHLAVHERGVWITVDHDGTVHHWRADDTEILAEPACTSRPRTDATTAPDRLARRRLALGADPAEPARMPRWRGDPLDLGLALDALVSRRHAALRRTVPTGAPGRSGTSRPPPD